jgi:hypothetical protein
VRAITENGVAAELRLLCRAMADALNFCGVTLTVMAPGGSTAAAAASDEDIGKLEELQFLLGEGPTSDAYASGQPVLNSSLATTHRRWVRFAAAASAEGVGGVYAFPLQLGAVRLGVLTCYSTVGRTFSPPEVARCLNFAETARDLLLGAVADGNDGTTVDVQQSLRIHTEVYQAQGMLKVALKESLADALVRLRAMAYSEGIDVNKLAADLVNGRRSMPPKNDGAC